LPNLGFDYSMFREPTGIPHPQDKEPTRLPEPTHITKIAMHC
jgi:hypothetical protein